MKKLLLELPSPLEIILDPLSLAILGLYILLILWEAIFPARKQPEVRFWILKGLTFFTIFFFVASYLPLIIDPYLSQYQVFNLSNLEIIPGALIGLITYELAIYLYHVSMHKFDFLWKVFHQMHHSAERLDTYGALFHSPLDAIGFTLMGSISLALLVGIPPQSITIVLLVINFIAFFQHANINTPHWLGYLIQRPESHSLHHGKGLHKYNYADLPIIDMIFGTFKNPMNYERESGFYHGASGRIMEMLMFKDVTRQKK
ncbi:sterol desaturase family protein [Aestuariivivens sediminis]|uniref:sterol desaturase family protein n=1 Tax=Aestuariivivens sediminis TaxID=2913557 RepID=UPI001F58BA65|nr:sterol desaturase family protein [Aestuariivivens sediminis]